MELRHLRYFIAIAEAESFSRASERLHVAQAALSQRIRDLEEELGLALFERRGRGVRLTPAGRHYHEEIRQLLSRIEAAGEQARQIERGELGSLRLGLLESFSLSGPVPRLLQRVREELPGLNLKLQGMHSVPQYQALLERSLDAGFMLHPQGREPELDSHTLLELPIQAMVPAQHPLAQRKKLHLKDLAGVDFIWPEPLPSNAYWSIFQEAIRGKAWQPKVVQEANSYVTMMSLVAAGIGCAFGAALQDSRAMEGIVHVPILDLGLRLKVDLVWRKDNPSPALKRFIALTKRS